MTKRANSLLMVGVCFLFLWMCGQAFAYCSASGGCDEYIYEVQVGTINNTGTGCSSYADYTSSYSTEMEVGTGYSINIVTAVGGVPYTGYSGDQCGIWIDWNQDGDFDELNEEVYSAGGFAVFFTTITPPVGALSGETRMRVRLTYTGSVSSCGGTIYGEVEDYTVTVTGGVVTTGTITGYKFEDVNGDSIWDAGEPGLAGWEIYLDINENGQLDAGEPNTVTVSGPAGYYEFPNLSPDSYVVAEVSQIGWVQTFPGGAETHSVVIDPNEIVELNFGNTDEPQPVTISGYVGEWPPIFGLKDVTVSASTGETTTTDIYGYYELTLPNPWTGTISPSKGNWIFFPFYKSYTDQSVSISDENYTPQDNPSRYNGGSGTESNPYRIRYPQQLQELGANPIDWDDHFILEANISLSDYTGEQFNIIGLGKISSLYIAFTGTFDGNGNTISNFRYENTQETAEMLYIGIFGYVSGCEIKDLTVSHPEVNGGEAFSTGSLIGYMVSGSVTNCSVEGLIDTSFVKSNRIVCGGLIGDASSGTISGCSASIDVTCTDGSAGGLVGSCGADLSYCKAEGTVTGNSSVGGLVSFYDGDAPMEFCQANSIVSGQEDAGGLVGVTYSPIKQSFSTGSVTVSDSVAGGLLGVNVETTIEDCYSTADVTGVYRCGGLVGFVGNNTATALISNCYTTGTISASHTSGSLVGQCFTALDITDSFFNENGWNNGYGTPISTAAMQTPSTYLSAGWDFAGETDNGTDDIWKLYHPQTYPKLNCEKYTNGTGTLADPFLIYSAEEMNSIGANNDDWGKCFKLVSDIDLSMYSGSSFNMIGRYDSFFDKESFEGIFDGNGHTISNFTYITGSRYVGLFCYVGGFGNTEIRNLSLTGVNIEGDDVCGGLVGYLNGKVVNCSVEGSVRGYDSVGGLVGYGNGGLIYDSCSSGTVVGNLSSSRHVGGLVGKCSFSEIVNSYSTSSVNGNTSVGGFVGDVDSYCKISSCYSVGAVTGTTDVGGFAGTDDIGIYTSCLWDQTVNSGLGGGIGNATSSDVVGHTTAELQTETTFTLAGWDFVGEMANGPNDDWGMPSGGGYPNVWWQLASLPALPGGLFSSGSGTAGDPYLISNAVELNNIGHNPQLMDKHFRLVSDIDLEGIDLNMIGGFSSRFGGVFDGGKHEISNFNKAPFPFGIWMGFFQAIGIDGYLEDLSIADPNVGSDHFLHAYNGVVASSNHGTIKNCMVIGGEVESYFAVGGIAATNAGLITHCYSSAIADADYSAGGIAGINDHGGVITKSVSAGEIHGDEMSGGIVGLNREGTVSLSHSSGNIDGGYAIGGIVGENHGTIVDCYSSGNITATSYMGGVAGISWGVYSPSSISNCYCSGVLTEDERTGGIIGANLYSDVESCFFDSSLNPGIVGSPIGPDAEEAVGVSTAEMQMASTFTDAGWDFYGESVNGDEDAWIVNEGNGYPVHFWERVNITGWFGGDLAGLGILSSNWGQVCSPDDCQGSDIDFSGQADVGDLWILAAYWLGGIE